MKIKNLLITLLLLVSFSSSAQNIFRTVCKGDLKRLDSLLQHNSINIQDNRDRSLLHWAIGCKKQDIFDALIAKGIDFNIEDNQKRTPLHLAVNFESEHCFDALQNLQTDNSWIDNYGPVLLESAVLNKSELFVEKLVKIGIDIDAKNERGSTPLEISKRIDATEIHTLLLSLGADENSVRTFTMNGAYMGQKPPELVPSMFAPNFISTEESEFGSFFSADGTEFYLGVDVNGKSEIRYSKMIGTEWSKPKTFLSHERYGYNDPFLSNDENRLYFISERALDGVGDLKDVDIWYIQKNDNTWSEPINAGPSINTDGNEYYISFTNEGTMYFSSNGHNSKKDDHDIYYSKNVAGTFQKSIPLGDAINTPNYEGDVFIAPDESYIIFCSTRDDGFGQGDLYISFKNSDDSWTTAVNMGEPLNTKNYEYCPFVSKDGNFLFYTSNQDIFWVSTDTINEIKNKM